MEEEEEEEDDKKPKVKVAKFFSESEKEDYE